VRRGSVERLASMQDVTIKVRESGPYLITGPVTLTDAEGNRYAVEGENVALCRCGGSQAKPFCDGSHKRNGFSGPERAAAPSEA
jgi:CDGSH-type Zn-finger protein